MERADGAAEAFMHACVVVVGALRLWDVHLWWLSPSGDDPESGQRQLHTLST